MARRIRSSKERKSRVTACKPRVTGSYFTTKEAVEFLKKLETKEDVDFMADNTRRLIQQDIEAGIAKKTQQVHDMVVQRQIVLDTLSNAKDINQAMGVIKNKLMGRNSLDTKAISLKNQLINQMAYFESIICADNMKYRSLNDIPMGEEGRRVTRELARNIYNDNTKYDVKSLTPARMRELANGMDEIQKLALAQKLYNEYERQTLLQHGIITPYKQNYWMKRRYDWGAISKMSEDDFVTFMKDRIDVEKTWGTGFTESDVVNKLKALRKDFEADAANSTRIIGSEEAASRTKSHARKIVYKDFDAEFDVFENLSIGSFKEQRIRNATSVARASVRVEGLGYTPEVTIKKAVEEVHEKLGGHINALGRLREYHIKGAITHFTGQGSYVPTVLTTSGTVLRYGAAVTKLGNALSTNMLDLVDTGRQMFYVNGGTFGGCVEYAKNFTKVVMPKILGGYSREEIKHIARLVGVNFSYMSNTESLRMAGGDLLDTGNFLTRFISEKGTTVLNIATLLHTQTSMSKIASGLTGATAFSDLVAKVKLDGDKITGLNKFEIDTLKEYGFSAGDIRVLQHPAMLKTNTWSDATLYSGTGIRETISEIGLEETARLLGVKEDQVVDAALNVARKYENFVTDFYNRGTPSPELAAKSTLFKNTNNEIVNVVSGIFTQFMDTPIVQAQNLLEVVEKLKRVNGVENGTVMQQLAAISPEALQHLGVYLAVGIPLYVAADTVMSALTQQESFLDKYAKQDTLGRAALMLHAADRTGAIPFVLDKIKSQINQYDENMVSSIGDSPSVGMLKDAFDLVNPGGKMTLGRFLQQDMGGNTLPIKTMRNWGTRFGVWDGDPDKLFGSGL